jgi:predicted nucleotidyltransferase
MRQAMKTKISEDILYQRLGINPKQLQAFCQKAKITELCLFGSILRDDFRPDSDLDILVTFTPNINMSLLQFVDLECQLKDLLRRDVDLIEKSVVEKDFNWIRRQEILNNYQVIYESQSILST